jgi:hypothetical protein
MKDILLSIGVIIVSPVFIVAVASLTILAIIYLLICQIAGIKFKDMT